MHLSVYLRKEYPLKAKPSEMLSYSRELFTGVMKTAIPVILTEGLWAVSVSCIFAAYGKISAAAFAVSQVAMTVTDFFQTVYFESATKKTNPHSVPGAGWFLQMRFSLLRWDFMRKRT